MTNCTFGITAPMLFLTDVEECPLSLTGFQVNILSFFVAMPGRGLNRAGHALVRPALGEETHGLVLLGIPVCWTSLRHCVDQSLYLFIQKYLSSLLDPVLLSAKE